MWCHGPKQRVGSACEACIGVKSLNCLNVTGAQGSLEALKDRP